MLKGTRLTADELNDDYKWAVEKVKAYEYRKTFGLSAEEYYNEPLEDFMANSAVMNAINQIENERARKARRQAK